MSIKIRLTRIGRHKDPIYRIVVADSRFPRDGRYIEQIGYYDPSKAYKDADLDVEKTVTWLKNGAQYSDSIKALLTEKGVLEKAKANKSGKKAKKSEKKHDFSKPKKPSHPKKEVFHPQPRKAEEQAPEASPAPEATAVEAPAPETSAQEAPATVEQTPAPEAVPAEETPAADAPAEEPSNTENKAGE